MDVALQGDAAVSRSHVCISRDPGSADGAPLPPLPPHSNTATTSVVIMAIIAAAAVVAAAAAAVVVVVVVVVVFVFLLLLLLLCSLIVVVIAVVVGVVGVFAPLTSSLSVDREPQPHAGALSHRRLRVQLDCPREKARHRRHRYNHRER
eukprot:COSAG05_NODE_292_length_12012_cov_12.968354_8_plen_149_part_00